LAYKDLKNREYRLKEYGKAIAIMPEFASIEENPIFF